MDIVTLAVGGVVVALIFWVLYRQSGAQNGKGSENTPSISPVQSEGDLLGYMTPQPIGPQFQVDDWDGLTGMQMALAVGLVEGECYPVILAGTMPPARAVQTVSTGYPDQDTIDMVLWAGLDTDTDKCKQVETVTIGPIPVTGAAVREVDLLFDVDPDGVMSVSAHTDDGTDIGVEVREQMLGAIVIGRTG